MRSSRFWPCRTHKPRERFAQTWSTEGKRIGEYDALIAGQAFARNLILVTANTREFGRVKGLVVEDWTS